MRRSILAALAAGSLTALGGAAHAQHYNTVHDPQCDGVQGEGDAGVRACYQRLADQTNLRRQEVYRSIVAVVEPAEAARLANVEALWMQYREAACQTEHDLFDGGTAGLSALPTCRLALTREHIRDLQDGYQWLVDKKAGR